MKVVSKVMENTCGQTPTAYLREDSCLRVYETSSFHGTA